MGILPWAGSEELWFQAALYSKSAGYNVQVIYPASRGWASQLDELLAQGVDVIHYGYKNRRIQKAVDIFRSRVLRKKNGFYFPSKKAKTLGDFVMISQGGILDGLEWMEYLQNKGINYTTICQANIESLWPYDVVAARMRKLYAAAKRIFFVSIENEKLFRRQIGYDQKNTEISWNPLQTLTPEKPLAWPNKEGDVLRIAMVGRIDPYPKGQDLLLEVISQDKWRSRPVEITIYGQGPWSETMAMIIEQRSLSMVKKGGFATPEQIWSSNHALLLPSRHEGKSLAMLEAMWLGRPVLATAVAGAPEEVIDGETGLLCAAATVECVDDLIDRAWGARDDFETMGVNAAARLRERMPTNPGKAFFEQFESYI